MRWIFRLVGALVLVVLVLVAGVFMLPAERVAGIAADQLRRVTGRDVTISGDVGLTFWPVLGVRAEGLEVGNASWAKEPAMLSTASAAIGIDAAALLSGEIRITNIEAQSPAIRLESRADGRASWEFTDASGAAQIETQTAPTRPAQAITIQKLTITDATLIYDAEGADTLRYEGVDLALDWPEPTAPAQIAATVRPAGTPVRVTATISDFAAFLAGAPRPLVAQLSGDGGTAALEGRASLDGAVEGALSLDLSSTAGFLSALGLAAPDLPQGLGQRVNATGQIVLTPDRRLALRGLNADLGGNRLRGDLDAELNGTPRVTANLNAGTLDLRALTGGGGQGGGGGTGPAGWPRSPIDASGLAAFNGVIALSADSVDLGALKLGRTVTRLTNDRARMVFALSDVAAYGGRLAGEFVMNNRNGLSVGGKLEARGVDMNPLLSDTMGLTRFTGTGTARLSFLGVGENLNDIMRSLRGDGALEVGRGSISGIDLDNLLGNFDVAGGTTVFDSLNAGFVISGGVLRNDDLTMVLPNFAASGQGAIDLGAQRIDYTVVPKSLRGNGGRGIAVPVRIVGAWADPGIRVDPSDIIDLNLREEREAVEERVKERVEEKLREELGVVREEGQSVEDAVKDRVEEKLKEELLRLFD